MSLLSLTSAQFVRPYTSWVVIMYASDLGWRHRSTRMSGGGGGGGGGGGQALMNNPYRNDASWLELKMLALILSAV